MKDDKKVSPWKLTPAEARAMDAIVEMGHQKLAARKLGLSLQTIQNTMTTARQKIGGVGVIAPYISWDRWRRGALAINPNSLALLLGDKAGAQAGATQGPRAALSRRATMDYAARRE
jgi:hypothetical protein